MMPVFLTYAEAATIARVPASTVRHWVAIGRLAKYKPGRHPLVKRDALIAFIEATAAPTTVAGIR
jgi:excisionase family DNA binding protein